MHLICAFVICLLLLVGIHLDSLFWDLWKAVFVSRIHRVVAVTLLLLPIASTVALAVILDVLIIYQIKMGTAHSLKIL